MARYVGPAVVVANGVAYACQAVLDALEKRRASRSSGLTSPVPDGLEWDGRLTFEDRETAGAVYGANDLLLHVTFEGVTRESGIVIDGGDLEAGEVLIEGNGPIPFEP